MSDRSVLILSGSTASGKTDLAIALAQEFDAEVVGADSRQIYRDMPVGTAAPSPGQLAAVPHHLIGFLDPFERYSAARYAADAVRAISSIQRRGKRAIIAGGTGFYIRALIGGVEPSPQYDETLRARLAREAALHPPQFLADWLRLRDPRRARKLHPMDAYRVLRALEIAMAPRACAQREVPLQNLKTAGIAWQLVFLDVPWPVIDRRISQRVAAMIENGLLDEAERLGDRAIAASAVGYPQALAYLRGWSTPDELRATLERVTRRYARRQRAWFRGERATEWMAPELIRSAVREKLRWHTKRK
ncbi:MAG: tRNA (adenosine(37)-N6)-dimethylallyltransferase MiaA [Candidatus Eremiobacteraeota bacterium]|nr:tRNA (adenosine(37)-N6)-dimethylallyltransferase MiaA [Candidatus Eremiobacteraeota bacterium]